MDFSLSIHWITGVMVGIEFQSDDEGDSRYMVLDLAILRFVFGLHQEAEE